MKIIFFLFFLCRISFLSSVIFAQQTIDYWDAEQKIKKAELNYSKGLQHGRFAWWDKKGTLIKESFYKLGMEDSISRLWYETGKIKSEEHWKNGKKHGKCIYRYANGQKAQECFYTHNKPDSIWTGWHENGKLRSEEKFKAHEIKLKTEWESFRTGKWIYYYENGQKESEGNFLNGKQEGHYTNWYDNGNKETEGDFKNDKKEGRWTYWYKRGQLREEFVYKD